MEIRYITTDEIVLLKDLYQAAFSGSEGELVGSLARDLSLVAKPTTLVAEPTTQPNTDADVISLGCFQENQLIGHIAFSLLRMQGNEDITGYILSPLAVCPAFQRSGIGRALIEHGRKVLCSRGVSILLVYGDPNYYGRFGFKGEIGHHFLPPYELDQPQGWLGLQLDDSPLPEQPCRFDCVPELHHQELW
jgi:putative acetyltransferase